MSVLDDFIFFKLDTNHWISNSIYKELDPTNENIYVVREPNYAGKWNYNSLFSDPCVKIRSKNIQKRIYKKQPLWGSEDFAFIQFSEKTFGLFDHLSLTILSNNEEEADRFMGMMVSRHWKRFKKKRGIPYFQVICKDVDGYKTRQVPVKKPFNSDPKKFDLFYGDGASLKYKQFSNAIADQEPGLALLQGETGVGKTTILRTSMWDLRGKCSFYTIPLTEFEEMTSSSATSFWLDKQEEDKKRLVLIIEDAENLIVNNGACRTPQLSTVLNLTDGLLGDLLGLTIIFSINADLEDIDPAVTRENRLRAFMKIEERSYWEAQQIADYLGFEFSGNPTSTYRLADIVAKQQNGYNNRRMMRKIGFGSRTDEPF